MTGSASNPEIAGIRGGNSGHRRGACSPPRIKSRISKPSRVQAQLSVPALKVTPIMSGISKSPGSPQIALLGVPIEIGASQRGTLMGPDALRTAGIGRVLEQLGLGVEDHGNLAVEAASAAEGPPPNNAKYYDDIKLWIRALSERAF